ncbi:MAG TPA: CCA tRNA nucleotidyltransferase [Actinomycetota bacterium]|nr:CCA tRNA nucleotidyltransferase [Actinomycetota bacterium]
MGDTPRGTDLLADDSVVMRVARRFGDAGHELYVVGGFVRDLALRRDGGADLDFATDARPDRTRALLAPVASEMWLQGERFGTIGARVEGVAMEITTFRTERYEPGSRHPDVTFESRIEADLSRRDFTVNAMAIRLPDRTPVDPFGGLDDLGARVLATPVAPQASFTDDPLRILRAFRFASQLQFDVHDDVLDAISELKGLLATVSTERVRDELTKLLLGAAPARALALASSTGVDELFLPELPALKLEQDPVHRHKDVFLHTLAVVERTRPVRELRLAALLHDVGKPRTRHIGPDGVSFHHHEVVGARMAADRLRVLRYPNQVVDDVSELIRLHHRFHTYRLGWSDSAVRRYVRDAGPLLGLLNELVRADCTTRNAVKARALARRMDELEARIAELAQREELDRIRPELDGVQIMAYLGVPPGPVVGRARKFLLDLRIEEGPIGADEVYKRLDAWARENGIEPAGEVVPPKGDDAA